MKDGLRERVLISLQRGLLGAVTRDLIAVGVAFEGATVSGIFVYDPTAELEDRTEIVQEVETLVVADLEDDVKVEFVLVRGTGSDGILLDPDAVLVFLRQGA